MLCLARDSAGRRNHGPSQDIVIVCPDGTRVTFTLLSIAGNRARIGVSAPKEYVVHRGEVQVEIDEQERIQAGVERAAGPAPLLPVPPA
jgi:sRNA-binding carbon storage regulator CsrA